MREALRVAAQRMGYRPMPMGGQPENYADAWGKPCGFGIMVICETEIHGIEWMQWFYNDVERKPLLWTRQIYEVSNSPWYDQVTWQMFLHWIKECENYHQKAPYSGNSRGTFDFVTLTQSLGGVP